MKFIKEAIQYYKRLKEEERARKRLVNEQLDYACLEAMIDRAENNPNLVIDITLKDGTKLTIKSKVQMKGKIVSDYINGEPDYLEIH